MVIKFLSWGFSNHYFEKQWACTGPFKQESCYVHNGAEIPRVFGSRNDPQESYHYDPAA